MMTTHLTHLTDRVGAAIDDTDAAALVDVAQRFAETLDALRADGSIDTDTYLALDALFAEGLAAAEVNGHRQVAAALSAVLSVPAPAIVVAPTST